MILMIDLSQKSTKENTVYHSSGHQIRRCRSAAIGTQIVELEGFNIEESDWMDSRIRRTKERGTSICYPVRKRKFKKKEKVSYILRQIGMNKR